jgi:hypothetical protein
LIINSQIKPKKQQTSLKKKIIEKEMVTPSSMTGIRTVPSYTHKHAQKLIWSDKPELRLLGECGHIAGQGGEHPQVVHPLPLL